MVYEDQTPEAIKRRILSTLTRMDTREGSFADDMSGPLALELSKMYQALDAVRYMVWVDETSGEYLDLAAEDLGMEPRKPGAKAEAVLEVSGKGGYVIPAGASFFTAEPLYFELTEAVTIPESGIAHIVVTAREVGSRYNVEAGAIRTAINCDVRLESVTNPDPAEGGADLESDQSLYARIVAYRQRPGTSGNEAHYEEWAREVDGVGVSKAQGLWNGPGTVKVLIADENSQPVDNAIVEACAAHIEKKRPIGPEVTVMSAQPYLVDISAKLRLKSGYDLEEVAEAFKKNLAEYFTSISLIRFNLLYNRIGAQLIATSGVIDYEDLQVNGQGGNLALSSDQVPVVGGVVFT